LQNHGLVETQVRQILVKAVQTLPREEKHRAPALAALFDPTDADRGDTAFEKFQQINDVAVRRAIAAKIAKTVE